MIISYSHQRLKMEEKYTVSTCSICKHKERDQIEKEILSRIKSQREIARKYGVSEPSLSNHKNKHMLLNMRERLKMIVQKSIMDGLEPDNVSELLRLMDYVERMESENYLDGKKQWDDSFDKKFKCLENLIMKSPFFNTISRPLRRGILVSVKHCFLEDGPHNVGKWYADVQNALRELPEDADADGMWKYEVVEDYKSHGKS